MTAGRRTAAAPIGASPAADGTPLLEVEHLRTAFLTPRGRVLALDDVSFTLEAGKTLGVVGESGSGKTVLARSILGLLPPHSTERSGTVRLAGRDLTALSRSELTEVRGRDVAMVFQDAMAALNPVMTVGRQITEVLRVHLKLGRRAAQTRAIDLLDLVGIPAASKRMGDYPHQLSGGMRQRAMIAIALAGEPRLLIADEPTTALDVTIQAQVLDLLEELRERLGMAMILITHDLGVVAGTVDEIAVMYAGQIVERTNTFELFSDTRHPYAAALLKAIPKLDSPNHTPLEVIVGRPPNLIDPPDCCRFAPRCTRAQSRCTEEMPLLSEHTPAHEVRCFFPLSTAPLSGFGSQR
jgi:peptide/nickel transport system ATP-binding protein